MRTCARFANLPHVLLNVKTTRQNDAARDKWIDDQVASAPPLPGKAVEDMVRAMAELKKTSRSRPGAA